MSESLRVIAIILMCAAITFGLRALPFIFFRGNRTLPVWLDRLGRALPPLIMAVLIIYCLKDVPYEPVSAGIPQAAGVLATAVVYKWRNNTLLGIAAGTAVYMLIGGII